jgi:hypothetical protein
MVESLFTAILGSDILMPPSGSMIILVGVTFTPEAVRNSCVNVQDWEFLWFVLTLCCHSWTPRPITITHGIGGIKAIKNSWNCPRGSSKFASATFLLDPPECTIPRDLFLSWRLGLDWCRHHLLWTARQCSTVCFSDESWFNVRFNDGRIVVCYRPGEPIGLKISSI